MSFVTQMPTSVNGGDKLAAILFVVLTFDLILILLLVIGVRMLLNAEEEIDELEHETLQYISFLRDRQRALVANAPVETNL